MELETDNNKEHLKSAYERAADDGVDPRCIPKHLEGEPPIGSSIQTPQYPARDRESWTHLYDQQMDLLVGKAGRAFLDGVRLLGMERDRIPALSDLSKRMHAQSGWEIARIPGLLHESDFFSLLSRRVFPSTDYIRGPEELDYTPAPDCFHDMFGHMPLLTEPDFADFYHLFGKAALNAEGYQRIQLERLHWFTVEFGLIREKEGLRIFGAGILSSRNEVGHALSADVEKVSFSADRVVEQDYEVWHLQPKLFVLDSFDQLVTEFRDWTHLQGLT